MQLKELCQPFSEPPTPISDDSQSDWITVYWTFCMSVWDQCGFRAKGTGDCLCSTVFFWPRPPPTDLLYLSFQMMISESQTAPPAAWTAFRWVLLSQLGAHNGSIFTSPSPNKSFQNKQRLLEEGPLCDKASSSGIWSYCLSDAKLQIDLIPVT